MDSIKSLHMNKVIFESSSEGARVARQIVEVVHSLQYCILEHVFPRGTSWRNELQTVTIDFRYQSYIAKGGSSWLRALSDAEAVALNLSL